MDKWAGFLVDEGVSNGVGFSELGPRSVCNPLRGSDLTAGGSSCALWWRWLQERGKVGGRPMGSFDQGGGRELVGIEKAGSRCWHHVRRSYVRGFWV